MGKHTPGPWEINYNCFNTPGMNVEITNEVTPEEVMVNAKIIMAAPKLYEALSNVLEMWGERYESEADYDELLIIKEARAAIATITRIGEEGITWL